MAELVDALDSKSCSGNGVWVRFPPRVLKPKVQTDKRDCLDLWFFFYLFVGFMETGREGYFILKNKKTKPLGIPSGDHELNW